jgi:hypothetical protein
VKLLKVSVLLCVLISATHIFAQVTGSITGIVTDSTGAVVAGARVTATNEATNSARSAETNSSGAYSITNLEPGPYRVVMEKAGFKTISFDDNGLAVAQAMVISARFTVGSVTEVMEVNGSATAEIETETSQPEHRDQ